MNKRRLASLVAGAVLVVLGLAACGGGGKAESEKGVTTTIAGVAASNHGTADVSGQEEIELTLDDKYFEPTLLKGKPGQKLTVGLGNEGTLEHTFTIDSESVDVDLKSGDKRKATVTFPASGTLSFYCRFHKSQGMAGGLEASSGY